MDTCEQILSNHEEKYNNTKNPFHWWIFHKYLMFMDLQTSMPNSRTSIKISFRISRITCIVGGVNVLRSITPTANLPKGLSYRYPHPKYNGLNESKIWKGCMWPTLTIDPQKQINTEHSDRGATVCLRGIFEYSSFPSAKVKNKL